MLLEVAIPVLRIEAMEFHTMYKINQYLPESGPEERSALKGTHLCRMPSETSRSMKSIRYLMNLEMASCSKHVGIWILFFQMLVDYSIETPN